MDIFIFKWFIYNGTYIRYIYNDVYICTSNVTDGAQFLHWVLQIKFDGGSSSVGMGDPTLNN